MNCWLVPFAIDALPGLIAIDVKTGAVTVIATELLIAPVEAVMVVAPWAMPVANPPLLTVATEIADEVHWTVPLRFCVLPLL
jgi:hypothetical protein